MNLCQSIFLLLAVATFASGKNDEVANDVSPVLRTTVHEVNLNKAFDTALPNIRRYIVKNGLDPLEVPDVEIPLSHLPGLLKTKMILHHGHVQELSTIHRTGDITLQYSPKKFSLYANIGWKNLDLSHQYSLRYMLFHRKGDCYGRFKTINARLLIDYDREENQIELKFFKIVDIGDVKIRLEGHLIDGLINVISSAVTKVFRKQMLPIIEAKVYTEVANKIQEINDLLPVPTDYKVVTKEIDIAPYRVENLYKM